MHAPLAVDSVTGVDVALPVAGPGARSFAFLIDWHIRAILSVAWYVVAAVQHNHGWNITAPLSPDSAWFVFVVAPPAAIYFLYHPLWEIATRGRTPGKRMAGLQIVSRDGGAPGIGALSARNVFRLIDSFPVAYAVGLFTTMVTRNHVRIGDLAAGTLLVHAHQHADLVPYPGKGFPGNKLDATTIEVVNDLLARWGTLSPAARSRIARTLVEDPTSSDDEATLRLRLEALTTQAKPQVSATGSTNVTSPSGASASESRP